MKTKIETPKAMLPGESPHSQAIVANGFVFTQGVICLTPKGKVLEGTIEEQVHQIMKSLQAILKEAGTSFESVVKTTIFVTSMSIYGKVNEVYKGYFSDPYPARETVCVKELPLGAEVEISMIAVSEK
ncbi:Rid family detoxifying hydrolase [Patescibacteria group bacterium]